MLQKAMYLARRCFSTARHQGLRAAMRQAVRYVVRRSFAGSDAPFLSSAGADRSELAKVVTRHSQSIEWLAECLGQARLEQAGPARPVVSPSAPRVSVIMPVWNRADLVGKAIQSLLAQSCPHWELLVIDDGSTDETGAVVRSFQADPRIRYRFQEHQGAAAARNRALAESRGDIIAYLDSDNVLYPHYLAAVIDALDSHPERQSVYAPQLIVDQSTAEASIRAERFSYVRLRDEINYIDMNVFAHRRTLFASHGGFDEKLTRCLDWDLVLRYTADSEPLLLPVLGGRYQAGSWDRITSRESWGRNYALVRRKHEPPVSEPLRVLYALEHYPQLSETYVRSELDYMRRRGVHIEVWGRAAPRVPFEQDAPVHRGSLTEAIERVRPHLVHSHWLILASPIADEVARAGLPMTVRSHSMDFTPELARHVDQHPATRAIFMFPHHLSQCPDGLRNLRAMNVCFNPDLHYPEPPKDRGMVFRTGLTKQSKNLESFLRIARRCPNHHFVMAITAGGGAAADRVKEMVALNRSLGCPVDVRVQIPHADCAALSRQAGIYLHTYCDLEPYGMPISVAEAMASGSYILDWECTGATGFLGDAGRTYRTEEQAAELVRATESWSDEQWRLAESRSIERAFTHFADVMVLQPMLDEWVKIARETSPRGCEPLTKYLTGLGTDRLAHWGKSFLAHLVSVYRGMSAAGCPEEACRAGMFHSIYGTQRFSGFQLPLERRGEVRQLLGERAERLAYLNCAMDRPSFDRAVAQDQGPFRMVNRFTGQEIELSTADFDDLCRVQLFDWLDQVGISQRWNNRRDAYRRMAKRLGPVAQAAYAKVFAQETRSPSRMSA